MQQALSKGERLPSLFSTTDEQYHAQLRRSVNSAFSMTALVQYEPFVDETTEKFLDQTQALYVSRNAVCDFAEWLQFYAFDVIGDITYSKRHGFVDRAEDVDGMIGYLGKLFSYVAPVRHTSLNSDYYILMCGRLANCRSLTCSYSRIQFSGFLTNTASCRSHFRW